MLLSLGWKEKKISLSPSPWLFLSLTFSVFLHHPLLPPRALFYSHTWLCALSYLLNATGAPWGQKTSHLHFPAFSHLHHRVW